MPNPDPNLEVGWIDVGDPGFDYWMNRLRTDMRARGYVLPDDPFLGLDWSVFRQELWNGIKDNWVDIALTIVPGGAILKVVKVFTKGRCFFVIICFVAGTDVLTPDGPRDIETIQPGELVWAFDGETSGWAATEVVATTRTECDGVMVQVQITDGEGSCETIECTEGHPFWVVGGIALEERPHAEDAVPLGAEPTAGGRWVEAGLLRAGDTLLTRGGGYAMVSGVTARHEQRVVYNLTLAGLHNYAVGDDGVLVHNACVGASLYDSWHKATFFSKSGSILYHWRKHGARVQLRHLPRPTRLPAARGRRRSPR